MIWNIMDIAFVLGLSAFFLGRVLSVKNPEAFPRLLLRFFSLWDKLTFPIWRPTLEKTLYIVIGYLVTKRFLFYTITADPRMPLWFFGYEFKLWALPGGSIPWLGWLIIVLVLLLLELTAFLRIRNEEGRISPTWGPMFYITVYARVIFVMGATW